MRWIATHKKWVFSGIGTALVAALLAYFLSSGQGTKAGRDVNTIKGTQGPAVIQTDKGTVNVENRAKP